MIQRTVAFLFLCAWFAAAQGTPDEQLSCDLPSNTSAHSAYRGSRANTRASNVSKVPIRSLLYPGSTTRIYARYMPWFGDPKHRDVGYRSNDREQVRRQVADMITRGIQGAIVDWYGPRSGAKNDSTLVLMKESEHQHFEFAVSEDAGSLADCQKQGCNVTDRLISDLTYAADTFEGSPAYVRFDGRPVLFFFGLEKYSIDWKRVRQSVPAHPLFFFRNSGTFANPDADGAYSWIAPETAGASDPMGMQYLERFYSKAQQSGKIAIGSAYKGFDDADASWGKGRTIDQRCGQTWLATFALVGRFYSSTHQLPALIIPTWNDYEEGTEVETGIDNCVEVKASSNGQALSWSISGKENTVDHIAILVQSETDWREISRFAVDKHSTTLRGLPLPPDARNICVLAVGKASMLNHSSGPIRLVSEGSN